MKVLFVCSGNSKKGISSITLNQANSLISEGVDVEFFTIKGKGTYNYLKSSFQLRKLLNNTSYNVIHAHYSLSGIAAAIAGASPLIVSLMGSDVKSKKYFKLLIKVFKYLAWDRIIVKSMDMKNSLQMEECIVIPNGVNLDLFRPIDRKLSLEITKWNTSGGNILFASDNLRPEKNYNLTLSAIKLIEDQILNLHVLKNIPQNKLPYYYNSEDVVVLTSFWEGSPNVIKEALACNRPIVCTDVGDAKEQFKNIEGCFICTFQAEDVAEKIKLALGYKKTNARESIQSISEDKIAKKIITVYQSIISNPVV